MRLGLVACVVLLSVFLPEVYAKKAPMSFSLSEESQILDTARFIEDGTIHLNNKICPLMLMKTRKKRSFSYGGVKYQLCCKKCVKIVGENPETYVLSDQEVKQLKEKLYA